MENLQELNISSASVVGRITFDDGDAEELSRVLSNHQNNWPRRSVDKLGLYEADGVRHHLGLDIETIRGADPDIVALTMEAHSFSRDERISASVRRRQQQQFSEIGTILSDLESSKISGRFHSHIAWSFPPGTKKPIINLPMMTIQGPGIPFTELVGVRLIKATEEGDISVTMDLRGNRSLLVTVIFPPVLTTISLGMLDNAVQRGNQLLRDFVLEEGGPFEELEGTI